MYCTFRMSDKRTIKDIQSWITSYKDRKQPTLKMRATDGALLVLDPKDLSKTIREYPVRRGYDLISLLQRSQHLDKANEILQAIKLTREERIEQAMEEVHRIEKELFAKVEERSITQDPLTRIGITRTVGSLQRDLELASDALQTAMTPVRNLIETYNPPFDPVDDTKRYQIVSMIQSFPYTFEERSIPIVKKTA